MKYTKKDLGSYNLHLIKTDKYKTINVRVIFRRKAKKEEITIRNILGSLLLQSTNKYDTKRKMTIEAQDLYSVGLSLNTNRFGNYFATMIYLNILNDKYTEKGNFNKALEFLNEVIFNPDIEDKKFKEKNIDIVKKRLKTELTSMKEDLNAYSSIRAMEAFDKDSPASFRMAGYLEDIDKVTGESLYEYYKDMISKDLVDIFVIGDIDEEKVTQEIKKYFQLRILKKERQDYALENKKPRKRRLFAKEIVPAAQSQVQIVCRLGKMSEYEMNYVLPIYNVIFGGGADSKLFKVVREKNSLCYSIFSRQKKLDNLFIIKTGINIRNYQKTLNLIERLLKEMQRGKFSLDDIKIAKEFFETSFDEIEENPNSVIDLYMSMAYLNTDSLEDRRKNIAKVTKNEIVKVAKKIYMDTIFTLEGDKDEKVGI